MKILIVKKRGCRGSKSLPSPAMADSAYSRLFIRTDSGPFHVAVAVGTPTIGVFARNVDEPEYYLYKNNNVFAFRESFSSRPPVKTLLKKAEDLLLKRRIGG